MMKRMRRLFPFLILVTGIILSITAAGYALLGRSSGRSTDPLLPGELANWPLSRSSQGAAALGEITRLHGKEFPLTTGAVGKYGADGQINLWIAGPDDIEVTVHMLEAMRERISEGNSPFIPGGERQDGDRTIFELDGMGQKHFYFQSGKLLVWLSANPELAEQAIREALKFYP
jgi:hypothetical protein